MNVYAKKELAHNHHYICIGATQGDLCLSEVPTADVLESHRIYTDTLRVVETGFQVIV
jgi:hypothetical protein